MELGNAKEERERCSEGKKEEGRVGWREEKKKKQV